MKKIFIRLLFLVFFFFVSLNPALAIQKLNKNSNPQEEQRTVNSIIVKYKKNDLNLKKSTGRNLADSIENKIGLSKKDTLLSQNIRLLKTNANSIEDSIKKLKEDPRVEYAEPNYTRTLSVIPDDPQYQNQWALNNIGQSVGGTIGTNQSDISAQNAWDIENQDQTETIVAIIDTGVDLNHPDLIGNFWDGSTCKDENNNQIVGGCPKHGWNFADNNNNTQDINGHGTFIAGIIGAQTNNSVGVSGISFHNKIKIMPLKFGIDVMSELKAIDFAKNNGAKVINASFTGSTFSQAEKDAIDSFPGLFVAAAGNEGKNNDISHSYPSDYISQNIISVTSTDQNDSLSSFSNYGTSSVDISAPGENILSTHIIKTVTNLFSENFDSSTIPSPPSTFTDSSGKWITNLWEFYIDDKYIYPGSSYLPNSNDILYLSTPIDTSSANALNLNFYLHSDIEYEQNCNLDYLSIETDNNDNNWIERKRFCNHYFLNSIDVDLSASKSNATRFRFVWHTNGSNDPALFDNIPITPMIDDLFLQNIDITSTYEFGSGTSFAAPFVTGASAMVFDKFPTYRSIDVKNKILNSGDLLSSLSGKVLSGKRLNLEKSLSDIVPVSIYRFFNKIKGNHFYTKNATEKNNIITTLSNEWNYEGVAYKAYDYSVSANILPLYRFWNKKTGFHFYTQNEGEKNNLINNLSDTWNYEGVAYYAYSTNQPGSIPLYRFFNKIKGNHFYTKNATEKNNIIATLSNEWNYEGEAWYVPE